VQSGWLPFNKAADKVPQRPDCSCVQASDRALDTPGPFSNAVKLLEKDNAMAVGVRVLKGAFAALSVAHKQVSSPDPNLDAMQKASQLFPSCGHLNLVGRQGLATTCSRSMITLLSIIS
jgi:hypothetical protein